MADTQTYKNHARWDPLFHFFIAPILLLNIVFWAIFYNHHHNQFSHSGLWFILIAVVLLLLAFKARAYALKAQDRVIRLEERLRLKELCSPAELVELESLTVPQYIALRFASNPELPELARRAVREKLTQKQIKQAIVSWRGDYYRV